MVTPPADGSSAANHQGVRCTRSALSVRATIQDTRGTRCILSPVVLKTLVSGTYTPAMSAKKTLSSIFGTLVIVGALVFALSGTAKGFLFAMLWDEESTLSCGGNQKMTITGKTVELAEGPVFSVGGDCELTLVDCNIKSDVALSVGGDARITIKGGRIEGTKFSIRLTGPNNVAVIDGAEIVGKVWKRKDAKLEGASAGVEIIEK